MNNYHGQVCDGNQKVIAIVEMFVIICSDGGYHGNVCDVYHGHNNINDHGNVRDDNHGHRRDGIVSYRSWTLDNDIVATVIMGMLAL